LTDKKQLFIVLSPQEHATEVEIAKDHANSRQKECEELVRKIKKKQKLIAKTEKLSADELLKKYRDHFIDDDDIELKNAADALDIRNKAVQITHPCFSALMQATKGFRPGEFAICGSCTYTVGPTGDKSWQKK